LKHLYIVFAKLIAAVLDLGYEPLQTFRHGPRDAQRHFVLKNIEDGKNKEGHGPQSRPVRGCQDAGDKALALLESVLSSVRRLIVIITTILTTPKETFHQGDNGRSEE